jgi:hypothetical protein
MAVYLDTNVLVKKSGFGSLDFTTTLAVCLQTELEIILPSLVLDELESGRRRTYEAAFDALQAAHRNAAQLAPIPTLQELPNPGELAREFRSELATRVREAPMPATAPGEALRREVLRIPPARNGVGARDAAIWLTVRDDHLSRSEAGYFVSSNSRDFSNRSQPATLHPQLAAELSGHPYELTWVPSLADLVDTLATSDAIPFLDDAAIGRQNALREAMTRLTLDRSFVQMLRPPEELGAASDSQLFVTGLVTGSFVAATQSRGYVVAGIRMLVSRVEWRLLFDLGTLEQTGFGRHQRIMPVECHLSALAWLCEGETADTHVAAVTDIASLRVGLG